MAVFGPEGVVNVFPAFGGGSSKGALQRQAERDVLRELGVERFKDIPAEFRSGFGAAVRTRAFELGTGITSGPSEPEPVFPAPPEVPRTDILSFVRPGIASLGDLPESPRVPDFARDLILASIRAPISAFRGPIPRPRPTTRREIPGQPEIRPPSPPSPREPQVTGPAGPVPQRPLPTDPTPPFRPEFGLGFPAVLEEIRVRARRRRLPEVLPELQPVIVRPTRRQLPVPTQPQPQPVPVPVPQPRPVAIPPPRPRVPAAIVGTIVGAGIGLIARGVGRPAGPGRVAQPRPPAPPPEPTLPPVQSPLAATQAQAVRQREREERCEKRRRKNRRLCWSGFYRETSKSTRFTKWTQRDCITGRVIQER